MSIENGIVGDITYSLYQRVCDVVLESDAIIAKCKTIQRGLIIRPEDLSHPNLFPWIFVQPLQTSEQMNVRHPYVMGYDYVVGIVAMCLADRGDQTTLCFGTNNVGTWDVLALARRELRKNYHSFGNEAVTGTVVPKWYIAGITDPLFQQVREIMANEFIDAKQINIVFSIEEDWTKTF